MIGFNNLVSTKRRTTTDGKDTYPSTFILQNIAVYLEQASAEKAAMLGDIPAHYLFTMITDGVVDIRVADLVIDQDANRYKVSGVNRLTGNLDVPNHLEVSLKIQYNDLED